MTWTTHKVVLQLLTPLHVGWRKMGNVQYTRPYVTGKTLWGALTARLTRDCPKLGGDYVTVGGQVNDDLAFSYFYPATGEQVDVWPWGKTADDFSWRYLNTYASTALDYDRNAAKDGSLHETEYIAPRTRDLTGFQNLSGLPVYLVGYIFEQEGCALKWRDALPRLQLGGERTYGWGRVAVEAIAVVSEPLFGQWQVERNGDRPALCAQADKTPLLAHALAHGDGALAGVSGPIEPLVGRETPAADAHGKEVSRAQVCWSPGGTVAAGVRVRIAAYGLWQKA